MQIWLQSAPSGLINTLNHKFGGLRTPGAGYSKQVIFMTGVPFLDVDYCQFSDWGYQKPTRIWGCPAIANLANQVCDHKSCPNLVDAPGGVRHREKLSGNQINFSTKEKYRMPVPLIKYLLSPFNPPKKKISPVACGAPHRRGYPLRPHRTPACQPGSAPFEFPPAC
jgi:hypothetical protein